MFWLLSQIKFGNISKKFLDEPELVRRTFAILFNMLLFKYVRITIIAKWREMANDFPCFKTLINYLTKRKRARYILSKRESSALPI